jgi:hypothetical protein
MIFRSSSEEFLVLKPASEHCLKCIFGNRCAVSGIGQIISHKLRSMEMIISVGLKQFGNLSNRLVLTEPFYFDRKVIRTVVVILGDNRSTGSSTVALADLASDMLTVRGCGFAYRAG